MTRLFTILAAGYVTLAVLANWLAARYTITVPFTDLVAPAGVLAIGAVLVIRDWLQQIRGLRWSLALMVFAAASSYLIGVAAGWTSLQRVALASVVAFTVSESLEAVGWSVLRLNLPARVAVTATVGNVIDSALFLWIAFGSLTYFRGQVVGKGEMIALGVVLTMARRRVVPVAS